MGKFKFLILKALMGICALVLMVSLGIYAEADDFSASEDYVVSFPEFGIERVVVPAGFPVLLHDGTSHLTDDLFEKNGWDKENILNIMAGNQELLYYYYPTENDTSILFINFTELDTERYCDEWEGGLNEEIIDTYFSYYRDNMDCFSLYRNYVNDHFRLEYSYADTNNSEYHMNVATITTKNDRYYWVEIGMTVFNLNPSATQFIAFDKFVESVELHASRIKDVELAPVPEVIDFPEYGIYNVKIPKGFSVFTRDQAYITEYYYSHNCSSFDDLYQTFADRPDRIARIIDNNHTYEIDIKAEPVEYSQTVAAWDIFSDNSFNKIYPTTFYDEYEVSSCHKGYWGDKYCVGAFAYDHLRDFYFHRVNFSNFINGKYYLITYNLNGYHEDFNNRITELYEDSVENVIIEGSVEPISRKYKENFFVRLLERITSILK